MSETTIHLGPRATEGDEFTVVRCYDDTDDASLTAIKYRLHGVESVDIDTPYEIGGGPESTFRVSFVNGNTVRLEGVVSDL